MNVLGKLNSLCLHDMRHVGGQHSPLIGALKKLISWRLPEAADPVGA